MKFQYLGTAAAEGWPALFCRCDACNAARRLGGKNIRTRHQALVNDDLLLDLGPDTYHHVLTHGLDLSKVANVLITHSHIDHFYPSELAMHGDCYSYDMAEPLLTVYGNEIVAARLESQKYTDVPLNDTVAYHALSPFQPTAVGAYTVTALLANHMKNEPCYFYMIEDGKKRILFAHDTGVFPEETFDYLKGKHLDFISLDATCIVTDCEDGHMGLKADEKVYNLLLQIGAADSSTKLVLSHFSHNGKLLHEELVKQAGKFGADVSFDGMTLYI